MNAKPASRVNYLDWLRVILILTVFIFHSSRFFDLNDWQVKNATTYLGPLIFVYFTSSWMMPLIFLVSAGSIYYTLGKRSSLEFIKDRALRLLVPLFVGLFTHAAIQAYLERVSHGDYSGTFWQFYPGYAGSAFTGGFNWTGFHLWYLVVLFILSLACLPLFRWLRSGDGARLLARLGDGLAKTGMIYLPILLLIPLTALIDPELGEWADFNSFGGWNVPSYLIFFLAGYVIIASERLQNTILRLRWISLAAGVVTTVACFGILIAVGDLNFGSTSYLFIMGFRAMTGWCFALAILGFGIKHLTKRTPFLDYANEAVLPFYVMHQSVLIIIGFFVVQSNMNDLLKWLLIAASSFTTIMLLYELLIRRINVLRFLFGMKVMKKAK